MKYIKGLDTLRAISIALVVIAHALPDFWLQEHWVWLLISGNTGVMIFFVISGYLITSLLLREKEKTGRIHLKNFFARRFLRLLPPLVLLYVVLLLLMVGGYLAPCYEGLMISMIYLYNFVPNKFYTAELGHTWSLALEEQFYFTWPLILGFLTSPKKIMWLLFSLLALCMITPYIFNSFEFFSHFKAHRFFIPAIAPILIGVLLSYITYTSTLPQLKTSIWLILGAFLFLTPTLFPTNLLPITTILQAAGVASLIKAILESQTSKWVHLLNNPVTSYIGKISYGIYVYQGLFMRTGPGGELWIQQFPQNITLTVFTAIISYELMEKYFLRLKSKYSSLKD